MLNKARKKVGIGLAAGLVIASAVGVTSMTSATGSEVDPLFTTTVVLDLDERSGTVTYKPFFGDDLVQTLATADPCAQVVLSGPELLTFTGSTTTTPTTSLTVQLPRGGLGTSATSNCGNGNAAFVSNGQQLTVRLGTVITGSKGRLVTGELEILSNARTELKVTYNGSNGALLGDTEFFTIDPNPGPVELNIPDGTHSINLEPQGGTNLNRSGVSLLGADFVLEFDNAGPLAEDSAVIDECDGEELREGESADTTFKRLPTDDTGNCGIIGVTIVVGEDEVFWDNTKVLGDPEQEVRGLVTVVWAGVSPDVFAERGDLKISYDGSDDSLEDPLWCESYEEIFNDDDEFVDVDAALPQIKIGEDEVDIFGPVPWCLASRSDVMVGTKIVTTTVFYGEGDPKLKFS
jgi:hypothetical protein